MNTHILYLVPAVALLWFPRQWMPKWTRRIGNNRKNLDPRLDRQPGDFTVRPREEFAKPRNYIDLVRGMIGGYLIVYLAFTLENLANRKLMLVLQVLLLAVGIVIQTIRWRKRLTLFAPIFFLTGVAIGIAGLKAGIIATATTWIVNVILPGPSLFLFVQALLLGLVSYLFAGMQLEIVAASSLICLPLLISLVTRLRLSAISKKT